MLRRIQLPSSLVFLTLCLLLSHGSSSQAIPMSLTSSGNPVDCVKPITLVDRWEESTGNLVYDDDELYDPLITGWIAPDDTGTQINISPLGLEQLRALQERDLSGEGIVAIFLDGKTFARDTMVVALGITLDGRKRMLGFVQAGTENAQVLTSFLRSLVAGSSATAATSFPPAGYVQSSV